MSASEDWSEADIVLAQACSEIERTRLPCPECGAGVPRRKCAMELGPDCPRHDLDEELNSLLRRVERLGGREARWWRNLPKADRIRPPSEREKAGLTWVASQGVCQWQLFHYAGDYVPKRKAFIRVPDVGNPPEVLQAICDLGVATLSCGPDGDFVELGPEDIEYAERHGVRWSPVMTSAVKAYMGIDQENA